MLKIIDQYEKQKELYDIASARAIISNVWSIKDIKRSDLDLYYLKRSTVSHLYSQINTNHDYIDDIVDLAKDEDGITRMFKFRMNYVNGSTSYLGDLIDKDIGHLPVICSFRGSKKYKTYSCLVLINPGPEKGFSLDIKEL